MAYALDEGEGTLLGPGVEVAKDQIGQLFFWPAYAGDLPSLVDAFDPRDISSPHLVTTARLLRLAGGLPESFAHNKLAARRFCESANEQLTRALRVVGFDKFVTAIQFAPSDDGRKVEITLQSDRDVALRPSALGAGVNWQVAFALWCAEEVRPEVTMLLLDEPAVHLDPQNQRKMRDFLWRMSDTR